ncbi:hypothetical protein [Anabaena azotica]|uniref:Uncharacterized protein n=1 Tax=Anabaena azotica FACHB-119 TaxID=947527 RepID=A0ABR8D989_9NOST|nr:hypothetical protein [Anabaena azotica]MBD2503141.1 hypothetical protein [Anabaena azotica FACHB-119]
MTNNTVIFQKKTWQVLAVQTADEVTDKNLREAMLKHNFEFLVLENLERSLTRKPGTFIIFEQRERCGVFRKLGEIFDPDSFK